QSTNSKNWHQQTWHTIEFSNNRHIMTTHKESGKTGEIFAFLIRGFSSLVPCFLPVKSAFPAIFWSGTEVPLCCFRFSGPPLCDWPVAPEQLS
ncbi:hypothetical protein ACFFIO_04070, partial [Citricoccus parietis]